ncbi:MAG: LPXTG cell wall anchor domain-containing protein [Gemmiger sp.]|nr:LPXTG cell wall anchor domain-containing protein [Gemmiger sp.]
MKKPIRLFSLLAALALTANLAALPALAEDAAPAPAPTATATAVQEATTTLAATPAPTATATPTPTPAPNPATLLLSGASWGGTSITPGTSFNLTLPMVSSTNEAITSPSISISLPEGVSLKNGGSLNQHAQTAVYELVADSTYSSKTVMVGVTMTANVGGIPSTGGDTIQIPVANTPGATAGPEPTATPNPDGAGVYVQAVTVTDIGGGEVTTVKWNDHINIVLRVVDHASARNHVTADEIATRINSSIFQYTGTGEISQLVEGTDNGGDYYSYVLLFRDVIYVGGGNTLPVDLSYLDSSMQLQQFSVTIGQCVDKDPKDPTGVKSPNLILRESSYGNGAVTAGTPFTLSLTVYASTGSETLNDVVASVTLPEHITLTGGSLSSYVGTISPGGSRQVSFSILPDASITATVANITVNMAGTGALTGTAVTSSSIISVPVSQPDRFELGNLDIPDTIVLGEAASVSLSFVNKGKNPVSNLEAAVSGENLGAQTAKQYIGNLAAGTENSVDFDLLPEAAGPLTGTITLSYEGVDGSVKTVKQEFSATVEEARPIDDGGMAEMPVEAPKTGLPIGVIALIVVAVVVAIALVVVFIRKKRKAAALNKLEDSDEDL